jgi:hypothetical protein
MTDRNSAAVDRMTPEEAMTFFNIKSSSYYERLSYLGEKPEKADDGKKYLSQMQIQRLEKLDSWIKGKGKMDGFIEQEGGLEGLPEGGAALTIAQDGGLAGVDLPPTDTGAQVNDEMDYLVRMAAQMKAQQLTMTPDIIRAIAAQMTEEDLPDDLRAMVQGSREALSPKIQPAQVAANLLDQWRSNRSGMAAAAV